MRLSLSIAALCALTGCHTPGAERGASDTSTGSAEPPATTDLADSTTAAIAPTTGGATAATSGDSTTTGAGDTTAAEATTGAIATTGDATTDATGSTGPAPEPPWAPRGCPDIYKQDLLPTFELEIAPSVLSALKAEWLSQDDDKPDHPLQSFRYEDIVITNASIRLRGNDKWWPDQGKMQFEVSFNTYDEAGRFMGLKHVLFDAARYNDSFLRDRLSLKIMRDVGLPAPCANNARLVLNGKYYGLFTSIEKVDSEFLERTFEEPDGNLYKRAGWLRKTNEEDEDESDIQALLDAGTLAALDAAMNLDEAVLEWAAEAVLPDADGAWAGGLNYYVYNDPQTGFNVIPWDLDATFDRLDADVDPYLYLKPNDWGRPFYKIATSDPTWFGKYLSAIAFVLEEGYDVPKLQARIDTWSAQIAEAAASDPNKPFSTEDHLDAVKEMRAFVAARAVYLNTWLSCWKKGGTKGKDGTCDPP